MHTTLSFLTKRSAVVAAAMAVTAFGASQSGHAADKMTNDQIIAAAGKTTDNSFCGTKPIVLGIHDGFGINGWSKSSMAAVRSEAAKCPNVKQVVVIGQGDLQKSIADVNGMVAQGINALVIIPDFGKSQLPSLRAATKAGVKVVAWAADPGGKEGKDYVAYVDDDVPAAGRTLGNWMVKALHGEGNVVYLGGPPGNPVSVQTLSGAAEVLKKTKINLLTGDKDWPVTNWDAAYTQKTVTALLAKYPKIDGIIDDQDGFSGLGVLRAYESANRPMVPFTLLEDNELSCEYNKMKPKNPKFELGTMSARTWLGRIAARKAIAAAEGIPNNEPNIYSLPIYEDTLGGKAPTCDSKQPADAYISAQFTPEELEKYGKTE
jgi:ribose transport system substrate-binding protein